LWLYQRHVRFRERDFTKAGFYKVGRDVTSSSCGTGSYAGDSTLQQLEQATGSGNIRSPRRIADRGAPRGIFEQSEDEQAYRCVDGRVMGRPLRCRSGTQNNREVRSVCSSQKRV